MRRAGLIFAAAVMLWSGGCTHQHVSDFAVPPPGARVRQAGAEASALMVSVADRRADKTSIGTCRKQPSSGMAVTVSPRQPLESVVRNAVEAEFTTRGYLVGAGSVIALIDIVDARADVTYRPFRNHIDGQVSLVATVMRADGRKNFERTFQRAINLDVESFSLINSFDEGAVEVANTLGHLIREMADDPTLVQALMQKDVGG